MRNTEELRQTLIEDLMLLRTGQINRSEARARAALAKNIIETLKVELASHALLIDRYKPVLLQSPSQFRVAAE